MRILFSFILILMSLGSYAQEKNSLLWEISGNGLEQTSYLYGTMHVSRKIAFRLDDVFYKAIKKSEVIALESDPDTWLSDENQASRRFFANNNYVPKGFYARSFALNNPKKEELAAYLAFEDQMINNILYRTNEYSQNFEEETYLDMFIYQAGAKYNKPIVALEDLEESSTLVNRASLNAMKRKPADWLQKKMQGQGLGYLMQDAYRERNINLIDSIDQGMYTEHYLKNMLYIRNRNMVTRLDSVMKKSKTFTGIGAAHLPGEKGVITMLRELGYTVKPLISKATDTGKKLKEEIENKIRTCDYTVQQPDDAYFSVVLPNKLYPVADFNSTSYISPDLANGNYVMVNRIPTFQFLKTENTYTLDDIDQLLFENIPGKILSKTAIINSNYNGLDIKNKLKNGDYQRYQIFMTPLEIVIFKMGGEGDYVSKFSDTIFNSIKFKKSNPKKVKVSSGFKDFSIDMPSHHNFTNRFRSGKRIIQGYDSTAKDYFFLQKVTMNDFKFIEEDTFELKQIQKRFYQNLKVTPKYNAFKNSELTSFAVLDSINHKNIYLKTVVKQGDYYLMGAVAANDETANSFFTSFATKSTEYTKEYKKVIDTALHFSTVTNIKPTKFAQNSNSYRNGRNKPKPYSAFNKKTIYKNKNNESIAVSLNKSHDFLMLPSIDSVWALRKKIYAHKEFIIQHEKRNVSPNGYHELDLVLMDTASTRGIRIKNIAKGGLLYEVKAVIDTVQKSSKFIAEFFENFKPTDTIIGSDILTDKTTAFFAALRKNDSIILNGHRFLMFNETHIDSLQHYISNFDYKDDRKYIQAHLIQELGKLKSPKIAPFLDDFYVKSYDNSNAQTKILQAVSAKADEESAKVFLSLLAKDLPLINNKIEIRNIFKPYLDSLPLAKTLFPDILDYSSIEEYKEPIFSLLAGLKSKGYLKSKSYKKYKKQLLNDAKVQLKRHLGQQSASGSYQIQSRYNTSQQKSTNLLNNYAVLLFPFSHEKEVRSFYQKLLLSKDAKVKSSYAALLAKNKEHIPNGMLDSLAIKHKSRGVLFSALKDVNELSVFPKKYKHQKHIAEALLHEQKRYNKNKYTTEYVSEKEIKYKGKTFTGYYFRSKEETNYNTQDKIYLLVYENSKGIKLKPYYKNNGRRINDTESEKEVIEMVTEGFLLKDRKRAAVYNPNSFNRANGFFGL